MAILKAFWFLAAAVISLSAAEDTIFFSLSGAVPVPYNSAIDTTESPFIEEAVLKIGLGHVALEFWRGEIQVDVISKREGKTTLTDQDFSLISWKENGRDTTLLTIDLARLMTKYFKDKPSSGGKVRKEEVDFLKRIGKNWRLVAPKTN